MWWVVLAMADPEVDRCDASEAAACVAAPPDPVAVQEREDLGADEVDVVVYGPERARAALIERLAALGYGRDERIRGGTRYRSDLPVQPYVDVLDDGTVRVQERGAVTLPGGPPPGVKLGNTGVRLWGPTLSVSEVVSARKLRPDRVRVMEAIQPEVLAWRRALAHEAFAAVIGVELPGRLQALWDHGTPLYGDVQLPTAAARRAALLAHWGSRACTGDGEAAAAVVERFLRLEVDASPTPLTDDEIAVSEANALCGRRLR